MDLYEESMSQMNMANSPSSKDKAMRRQSFGLDLDIDQLYNARDRLREFAYEIGDLKDYGIRKDVIEHCDRLKIGASFQIPFQKVERMVKNRIQKMIKNRRVKKNWSEEDVQILIWVISKYSDMKAFHNIEKQLIEGDWKFIAELIPGVIPESCMFKWFSLKKYNLSHNNWSQRQSEALKKIIKTYGEEDWHLISQELYYSNNSYNKIYRSPKQCRQHWNCYLNPNLKKGPWSKSEDQLLLRTIKKNNGQKRWAEMVKMFNGRTENALKNRFTLIIDKQVKQSPNLKKKSQLDIIQHYFQKMFVEEVVSIKLEAKNSYTSSKQHSRKYGSERSNKMELRPKSQRRTPSRLDIKSEDEVVKKQYQEAAVNSMNFGSEIPNILEEHFSSLSPLRREKLFEYSSWQKYEPDKMIEEKEQESDRMPEKAEDINIMPLNLELLNLNSFGKQSFYPCVLINNQLRVLNQK